MDKRVAALKTPEDCERFIENALRLGRPDLAQEARQRAVGLRAQAHGAATDVEREALEAVYAYEAVLAEKHGRKVRANRLWPMIQQDGIISAVERCVEHETSGYTALVELGLQRFTFEAVVLRYPNSFSEETVERCRRRAAQWQSG